MTPCSSIFIDSPYCDNLLAEFDDSIFKDVSNSTVLDLDPTPEIQELFSKSVKRKSSGDNTDFQTLTKKTRMEPSLTSEVGKIKRRTN